MLHAVLIMHFRFQQWCCVQMHQSVVNGRDTAGAVPQARTFHKMSQHYVHVVMSKPGQQGDQYQRLWLEATAVAATAVLR